MGWLPTGIKRSMMMWLSRRLPACDEAARLSSEELDRSLAFREKIGLKVHLTMCRLCRRYYDQIHFLHDAVPLLSDRLQDEAISTNGRLSDDARARIKRLLSAGAPPEGPQTPAGA